MSWSRSVQAVPQPVSAVPKTAEIAGRASVNQRPGAPARLRKAACSCRRALETKRSGRPSRLTSAAAIPMPAFGSSTPWRRATSSRRKPSLAPGRDVDVQPVRVGVVRDEDVEPAVDVDVGEHDAEAVLEAPGLQAGLAADLAEPRAAALVRPLVQVEEVALTAVVRREASGRGGDRRVDVGVARDDEVRAPVAVQVPDRGAGVPAEVVDPRLAGALGERPVALVPEQRVVAVRRDVVARGRHVQVGVAVQVEVRGDAAAPAQRQVGARTRGSRPRTCPRRSGRARSAAGRLGPRTGRGRTRRTR